MIQRIKFRVLENKNRGNGGEIIILKLYKFFIVEGYKFLG